jgi:comEA protein
MVLQTARKENIMKMEKTISAGALVLSASLFLTPAYLFSADTAKAPEALSDIAGQAAAVLEKVNINSANVDALGSIPGIGPKIGEAIAAYREANGAFSSVADLVNIEGIDAALLEKITPFLTI